MKTKKFIKAQDEFNAEASHHIHSLMRRVNELQEFVSRSDDQMEYNEERMTRIDDSTDAHLEAINIRIDIIRAEMVTAMEKLHTHDIAFHPIYNGLSRCDGRLNDIDTNMLSLSDRTNKVLDRLSHHDGRMNSTDSRVDDLIERLQKIERGAAMRGVL